MPLYLSELLFRRTKKFEIGREEPNSTCWVQKQSQNEVKKNQFSSFQAEPLKIGILGHF